MLMFDVALVAGWWVGFVAWVFGGGGGGDGGVDAFEGRDGEVAGTNGVVFGA